MEDIEWLDLNDSDIVDIVLHKDSGSVEWAGGKKNYAVLAAGGASSPPPSPP